MAKCKKRRTYYWSLGFLTSCICACSCLLIICLSSLFYETHFCDFFVHLIYTRSIFSRSLMQMSTVLFGYHWRFFHGDFLFIRPVTFVCTDEQDNICITFFFGLGYPVIFKRFERLCACWIIHQTDSIRIFEVLIGHCSVLLLSGSVPDLHSNLVRCALKLHNLNFSCESTSSCCFAGCCKRILVISSNDAGLTRPLLTNHNYLVT